jgi:hypothetical protein
MLRILGRGFSICMAVVLVVERGKRAGSVAQDGFTRRAKFNAVMIMPRGEALVFRAACVATVNQWRCLKCTCEARLPSRFKHQLRLHKDRNDGHSAFRGCPLVCLGRGKSLPTSSPLLSVDINLVEE